MEAMTIAIETVELGKHFTVSQDLTGAADRRVTYYSTGMRQKLALAGGLLTDPEILLLDEPSRSVDRQ